MHEQIPERSRIQNTCVVENGKVRHRLSVISKLIAHVEFLCLLSEFLQGIPSLVVDFGFVSHEIAKEDSAMGSNFSKWNQTRLELIDEERTA